MQAPIGWVVVYFSHEQFEYLIKAAQPPEPPEELIQTEADGQNKINGQVFGFTDLGDQCNESIDMSILVGTCHGGIVINAEHQLRDESHGDYKVGMRIELRKTQALQLIEKMAKSMQELDV